jgi:hypothetical protein
MRTIEQGREVTGMEKQCCNVNVTELDNGYRLEITGDEIKAKCKTMIENCCAEGNMKNWISACCGTK